MLWLKQTWEEKPRTTSVLQNLHLKGRGDSFKINSRSSGVEQLESKSPL